MAFRFLQRLSAFSNGFPTFFNGFLLSPTAFRISPTAFQFSSTAFCFPRNPRKSIYGSKYTKDHHSSFVFPASCSLSFVIATCSPRFVTATRSPSFVIATRSPSFVIATMRASHPTTPKPLRVISSSEIIQFSTLHEVTPTTPSLFVTNNWTRHYQSFVLCL